MGQAFSLMDIIFLVAGLYIVYTAYQMKVKGEIKEGVLLPREVNVKKCIDKQGYINEVFPKTAFFGVMVSIWGGISLLDDQYHFMDQTVYLIIVAIFVAITIWFALSTRKAYNKYWPQQNNKSKKKS